MKKILLTILVIVFAMITSAQNKSTYDLEFPALKKTASPQTAGLEYRSLQNDIFSATMISGGYYTLGTTSGITPGKLDDNCLLTFGHPYALTSYPVFSVDGSWTRFDKYFTDPLMLKPVLNGDTLSISAEDSGKVSVSFSITLNKASSSLLLSGTVTNLDNVPHTMGAGLVMDPALGKWGDAYFEIPKGQMFTGTEIPNELVLWEKGAGAKGLCMNASFDGTKPDKLIAGNWSELYSSDGPDFNTASPMNIYDLLLKMYWPEKILGPGESSTYSVVITLPQPDFSSKAFLRWDVPGFLSIEDNDLFPGKFDTFIEASNTGNITSDNLTLKIGAPSSLEAKTSEYPLQFTGDNPAYVRVALQSHTIYQNKILNLSVKLFDGSQLLDELNRNVFLPATAISDTGLYLEEDSLDISGFPQVNLFFQAGVERSGQVLYNLTKDNIFLFENSKRIDEFSMGNASANSERLADVVFVLDVSGSMGDNIRQVTDNLGEFADSLAARGYDYRIGVVTFSTTVDHIWDFTSNIEEVKNNLNSIALWGGEEDSPSALYAATGLSFRPGSIRTIIWLTDENYTERYYNKQQVVNKMLEMGITVNGVGTLNLQTDWFDPIVLPTGGKFYNIFGNFRDIMLDISRMEAQGKYVLSYQSQLSAGSQGQLKLEVHYGGLGVSKTYIINQTGQRINSSEKILSFYPNPFNPEITFNIRKNGYSGGTIRIYNSIGQMVSEFYLNDIANQKIVWNARNNSGKALGTGLYIVQLILNNGGARNYTESAKILYLK